MRVGRSVLLALAAVVICAAPGSAARADAPSGSRVDAQDCVASPVPDRRVAACTAVLDQTTLPPKSLAEARYYRGLARLDLRAPDAAAVDLSAALQADPDLWPARWVRADLLVSRRDYDDSVADWTALIRQKPDFVRLYANRGAALDNEGRGTEAIADFTTVIERAGGKPASGAALLSRAVAFEGMHQYDRALTDLDEALKRDGTSPDIYFTHGRVAYLIGNDAMALADFAKTATLHPGNSYYLLWRYLAELRTGRDAATDLREGAGQIDPGVWPGPIIRVLLGDLAPGDVKPPAFPVRWSAADQAAGAHCELDFYQAEVHLLRGERDQAHQLFQAAVDTGVKEYVEYRAATMELGRMVAQ